MISEAEREAQEAEAARRRDEQPQRELRGALESQQRTVDSAVTDTQQRVGGESAVHVTCYHGLLKREFLYLQHQSTSNAVCLLITSCFLDTRSSVFSTHVPVSLSVSNETASADVIVEVLVLMSVQTVTHVDVNLYLCRHYNFEHPQWTALQLLSCRVVRCTFSNL